AATIAGNPGIRCDRVKDSHVRSESSGPSAAKDQNVTGFWTLGADIDFVGFHIKPALPGTRHLLSIFENYISKIESTDEVTLPQSEHCAENVPAARGRHTTGVLGFLGSFSRRLGPARFPHEIQFFPRRYSGL